jgi:1-acyl-sn-glycerol-3-phosphate acyltransferase
MIWLRSALFNVWLYGVTTAFATSSLVPRALTLDRPAAWPLVLAQLWARCVLVGLRVLCGIRWTVSGRDNLPPEGPMLIASNHQSAFDTMIWLLLLPAPSYVIKRELLRVPLFGALCRLAGMIAVDRTAGADAIRSLLRAADSAVARRRQIVIFPEGTRVAPGAHIAFQPGVAALATRTRLPVIPVATDSGHCWGRRAFRKMPGVIHVRIGAPLPTDLPREALMRRLEQAIAEGKAAIAGAGA